MHICLYFEGLKQHIQLHQQNEKTIHKLEIHLQTLTEKIKKTQEEKVIAEDKACTTIQQIQFYLDKAETKNEQMERKIKELEEQKEKDAKQLKGNNIRCIYQLRFIHDYLLFKSYKLYNTTLSIRSHNSHRNQSILKILYGRVCCAMFNITTFRKL